MFKQGTFASKILAVSILILVLLTLYEAIFSPLISSYENANSEIEQKAIHLNKLRTYADRKKLFEGRLKSTIKNEGVDKKLISAASVSQGNAELQKQIKLLLAENKGQIRTLRNIPIINEDGLIKIGVSFETNISLDGLIKTLSDIENGSPLLVVSNLLIRSKRQNLKNVKNLNNAIRLDVRMTIHGLMKEASL